MTRTIYRATRQRQLCAECDSNIRRGMPVVYVAGRPIHASCERLADLRLQQQTAVRP